MDTLFDGRYRIIKTIGSGGMGTVYLAQSTSLGTNWAIKLIPKKENANFDFLAEPNILKKLNHPALPRIIDIQEDSNNIYIIEDYIEGVPLDKQLQTRRIFDEATVIEWAKQLCNILRYLHTQKPNPIIYRDMKPSNIIVSPDNRIKLIDFGIAREFKHDSGSDTSYMGTRGYAAPEQYGTSQTDARTDIYSLGVTLYHLLSGKSPNEPPYEFKPLRTVDDNLSEGIEYIVNKCIQNNPLNRYQNVDELLYDLENIHTFNTYYKVQKRKSHIKTAIKISLLCFFIAMMVFSGIKMADERGKRYDSIMDSGYYYLNMYKVDDARKYFDEAISINSDDPEPYLGNAQIYLKQGRLDECIAYVESIEKKMPECTSLHQYNYLKGSVLYEKAEYEEAIAYLKAAHDAEPNSETYNRDLAVCYAKSGNLDEAGKILDIIEANGISDEVTVYVSGQILLADNETNDAIDKFESVISATENEDLKFRSYMELSNIYKSMRHDDKDNWEAIDNQIEVLERAVKDLKDEDNLIITEAMAEVYFVAKEYDLSIQKFSRLLELGYERDYIYRNIAIIYQQTGNYTEAENILFAMKEKYPDNYKVYLQLAYLYMDIEGEKDQDDRDYSIVAENYDLAVQFAPSGKNTSDILQLTAKINELKSKGWL